MSRSTHRRRNRERRREKAKEEIARRFERYGAAVLHAAELLLIGRGQNGELLEVKRP